MAADQAKLNSLLQWGIENSASTQATDGAGSEKRAPSQLNPELLAQLLGGPSDADLMRQSMTAILAPTEEVNMEAKLVAWDNFEQLIEQIDNAMNMESLGLWTPLLSQLDSEESDNRRMAAWCINTAVQNNVKCQERLLAIGGVKKLAIVATEDKIQSVRKKAIGALSSEVRNYQPALDELEKSLPSSLWEKKGLDAGEMDQVDELIGMLRENASKM